MLKCQFCNAELVITPSGVAVACSCDGARQDEVLQRARRSTWHADRMKANEEERKKRQRVRR